MARRLPAVLVLTLAFASGWVWQPAALADTAQARAPIDLDARLKEVVANPSQAEDLFKIGRKVAAVCANCHGEGGNSVLPSVPNLAGQNPAYLLEQVRQFADGRRRYEFMEGMIRAMSNDEKIGSVLFYSRKPGEDWGEAVARSPEAHDVPLIPQAEALAWTTGGAGLYATGEFNPAPIFYLSPAR